ncbi:hypothetical protein ABZP36_030413 [Zizania latifolia]
MATPSCRPGAETEHALLLLPRRLPLLCFLLLLIATTANAVVDCPGNANYSRGSAFEANLGALLSSLPSAAAASSSLFAENTTGAGPDRAYGLAQCRADVADQASCRTCLDGAVHQMAKECPGQKSSTIFLDGCIVRYSNESFFGASDDVVLLTLWNTQNTTQPEQFKSLVGKLMSNLTDTAAHASPRMFAADEADLPPFIKIFGMAQCTRDLAAGDCYRCLVGAVTYIPKCCDGKQGGQVITKSCAIRYEVYPFFDAKAAKAAMSPAPAPAPETTASVVNGSDHSGKSITGSNHTVNMAVIIPVTATVALLLVIALLLIAFYLCKRNRKTHKHMLISKYSNLETTVLLVYLRKMVGGYMSPEYALHGIFSAKSDVFSYGVLLLEIVTGRRNTCIHDSEDVLTLVWRHWRGGDAAQLLDSCPGDGRRPQELLRCIHVGLLCVQEEPQQRPGMAAVVVMLNSRSVTLPAPSAPAFVSAGRGVGGNPAAADGPRRWSTDHEVGTAAGEPPINSVAVSVSDFELR